MKQCNSFISIFNLLVFMIRSFFIKDFSFRNRFGPSLSYDLNCSDPNINIAIELK